LKGGGPGKKIVTQEKEVESKSLKPEFLTLADITLCQPAGW